MLYKNDSKKRKYKRKFYRPINFNISKFSKENKVLKKLLLNLKISKGRFFKKDTRFLSKDKPQLVLLGSIRNNKRLKGKKLIKN